MNKIFSIRYSMETVAALLTVAGILGVLQTFIIGKHFVIPTMLLAVTVLLGNLARAGYNDSRLAKQILFWLGFILACHLFFALFWAHTPRQMLGTAFYPVYGGLFVVIAFLTWQYGRRNHVFT